MPTQVTVNWVVELQLVVDGSQYTHYQVSLVGDMPHEMFVPFGQLQAVFPAVASGQYIAQVALSNEDGSVLGPMAASDVFTVTDDGSLDVPVSVTVTMGPTA